MNLQNRVASKNAVDQQYFKKLSIRSVLDLALLVPHRCEDYTLKQQILPTAQVVKLTVQQIVMQHKRLQIKAFSSSLNCEIELIFFHPKNFQKRLFTAEKTYYVYGLIERETFVLSMKHPKIISENRVGRIVPFYKTVVRSDVVSRLMQEYLSKEALLQSGLTKEEAAALMELHFPRACCKGVDAYLPVLKFVETFSFLQALQSKKRLKPSQPIHVQDLDAFIATLPFTLTGDQQRAIETIRDDLNKQVSAKRIIVGDVGCGKSVIICAVAFLVHPHKAILMAPTTLLAKQLFEEAKRFLPTLKITLVTNKSKKVDLSRFDFIIGTHALLFRELPKSAVVMVDEQHRFGTNQRQQLEQMVNSDTFHAHFFQFTATPIPRTLAMVESAHIDVTQIKEQPFVKDISTQVIRKENFNALLEHITHEIALQHQVLIIYPLVQSSEVINYMSLEEATSYWEKRFSNVYMTHGKDKQKERVLERFRDEGDVLLATTVVEVGISLPRLSTIVIVGAERLGLSTLHQLRGRVSRNGLKGYCFLFTYQKQSQRLEKFAKLSSGFDIAELDLQTRQSGDLLYGDIQSGVAFKFIDFAHDEAIIHHAIKRLDVLNKDQSDHLGA